MNHDDYESLPTTSLLINMTAGATAGIMEHTIVYPLDSVKTRMQSLLPPKSNLNITETFQNMIRREGVLRPVRGISAVIAGAGPAHACYFGSYELSKELIARHSPTHNNINYMASAAVATIIHDGISNPTDVIKQRIQMYNSPYMSVIACVRDIYKQEGFRAFYRSYTTQLAISLPYQAIHFSTYEFFQNTLNQNRGYNPLVHMVAGGVAGATAAAITTPLDVVKTLLNTQETGSPRNMLQAIRWIHTMAGFRGFFKGISARVLYAVPATAICWSTYEFLKYYLCGMDREKYKSSVSGKSELISRDDYVLPKKEHEQQQQQQKSTKADREVAKPTAAVASSNIGSGGGPSTSGAIKTVCELSPRTAAPTISLHTRHTNVAESRPYERGFPRS